jgi:hypothetical protein
MESARRHLNALKAANAERTAGGTAPALKTAPPNAATVRGQRVLLVPGPTVGSFTRIDAETGRPL